MSDGTPRSRHRETHKNGGRPLHFTDDPLWYKDAVIYQLHIKSYFDANNDGIGDFAGLIDKLDYIAELGVNTVWLLPFYPSPRRDDGYDIAAYKGVHEDYGSLADARRFIAAAHARGLRVITELVINHTSDQHPWFQRARHAKPGSPLRDFYVWSDTDTRYAGTRIIFLDTEKSNWTWDPVANAYYWHRFYSHQPDLNFDNPRVMKAVLGIMRFWLEMGVDGLRLDAVPYLVEREGTSNENLPETHVILKRIRAEIDARFPGRMLLAEANMWPEDVQQYFGGDGGGDDGGTGDECHMAFHFPLMPRMFMAIAQEDRFPIADILRQTPDIPANCQWAIFLRNHDELTLEMVTDRERDYLWEKYASDRRARLNLGIRRRLAPLMERDRRRIELLNSLLLSMPGTPVIYYGDEIGMGDNIHLGDRDGVRTPMQWSLDRNGGFSRADPASLVLPPVMDPLYGFQAVNVEAQSRDPHSLLNWMRRMLAIRSRTQAFGRGSLKLLYPRNRHVLAYLREQVSADGVTETVLCVANVSRAAQAVELDLAPHAGRVPVEMVGGAAFPPIGLLPYLLTLPPYGFYWFLLASEAALPPWHAAPPEPLPEFRTLVIRRSVEELLDGPARQVLEHDILPVWLPRRRWFGAKDEKHLTVRIAQATRLEIENQPALLAEIEVQTAAGAHRYLLPLGFAPEDEIVAALPQQLALARVRHGARVGMLTDASALDSFARELLALLKAGAVLPAGDGVLRFGMSSRMAGVEIPSGAEVRRLSTEQSNSSLIVGDVAILKLIRRLSAGPHPESEMGIFLTERGFPNVAPTYGEIVRIAGDGSAYVLAVVQGFLYNQGDAWTYTHQRLSRALADADTVAEAASNELLDEAREDFAQSAATLGRRLGELHEALAGPAPGAIHDEAFAPRIAGPEDCAAWAGAAQRQFEAALQRLTALRASLADDDQAAADWLAEQGAAIAALLERLAWAGQGSLMTRIHGDLHLSQVLVAQGDVYFIDFEGEPLKPLAERRAKASPLRDVAGLIRSFDYAAATAARSEEAGLGVAQRQRRAALIEEFRQISERAFLAGYRESAQAIPHQWAEPGGSAALVDLFTLEKAAYEILYEAANRPAWLSVPLQGLLSCVRRLLPPAAVAEHTDV